MFREWSNLFCIPCKFKKCSLTFSLESRYIKISGITGETIYVDAGFHITGVDLQQKGE